MRRVTRSAPMFVLALLATGACRRLPRGTADAPPAVIATSAHPDAGAVTPKLEPSAEAQALSNAFAAAAKAIRPCVVRVDVEGVSREAMGEKQLPPDMPEFLRRFFHDLPETPQGASPGPVRGTGSGVIVDSAGNVLTNGHVVRGARKVTIGLADQRQFAAFVVGVDQLTDVGIVRFEKPPAGLVAARLGDSDKLRIGEWAIAVGSPLGMDQTVTVGIISGVGATGSHFHFESGERVRKYIQTDAKINPGNSGGPLVNLEGEVVGLNTLINVGPGGSYGFAIPINQAWQVAGVIIKEGHVRYPYIGVSVASLADLPKDAPERTGKSLPPEGALVSSVSSGSPAVEAGLAAGDVITKVGGHPIKLAADVVAGISEHKIGDSISVDYLRDGRSHSVDVKIKEYPAERPPPAQTGEARLGVALQTMTPSIAETLGLDPKMTGAIITEIAHGSPADRAGLAPGDVIREIDKKPVNTAEEAVAAMRAGKGPRLVRITDLAGTRYVTVHPE